TLPMRSATGSRVRTSTGRSPPGVAANQISPRCIVDPVGPVLGRSPVGDLLQCPLPVVEGRLRPPIDVVLRLESIEVAAERLAQQRRPVHAERVGPSLRLGRDLIVDPEAQHRHTYSI